MSRPEPESMTALGKLDLHQENRVRLTKSDALIELRDDLMRASYQSGDFHLESGMDQSYFFDKYLMFARPSILRRLSRFMALQIPETVDQLASPTLGAVLLGTAVSLESGLPLGIVRTDWEGARRHNPVEGGLHPGVSVAVIEDIVATGNRALQTVERLLGAGAQVVTVLCVVDCEQGARGRLFSAGVDFWPLFTYSALTSFMEPK